MGSKSEGASRFLRFFKDDSRSPYQADQRWQNAGLKGRVHFGIMMVQLSALVALTIIATGFFLGWVRSWFV